jgi:outer membrane receptor protein involved in Fe transport
VSERNRDYRGVNQLPSYALLGFGLELAPGAGVTLRADVEDLFNRQPAYIAGYPSVGRTLTATISYELP